MKIGVLTSDHNKKEKIDYKEITKNKLGFDIDACLPIKIGTSNVAKKGRMITVFIFGANAAPKILNKRCKVQKMNLLSVGHKWCRNCIAQ